MEQGRRYEVLEGVVEDLEIRSANVHFSKQAKREKRLAAAVAVGQAMAGQGGSVLSSQAATDEGDPVESFSMTVGGDRVSGSFWKVTFENGDHVKVVGKRTDGDFAAAAVLCPKRKVIWMLPHSERGTRAQGRVVIKRATLATALILLLSPLWSWDPDEPLWFSVVIASMPALLIWGVMVVWSWRDFMAFSREMNLVAEALGWPSPEETDLFKSTRQARKSGNAELPMGVYYY